VADEVRVIESELRLENVGRRREEK